MGILNRKPAFRTFLYLSTLLFVGISYGCDSGYFQENAGNISEIQGKKAQGQTALTLQANYTPSWDWRIRSNYIDYDGNSIPMPFDAGHNMGVDLTNSGGCQPSDGWRLLAVRMGPSTYPTVPHSTTNGIQPNDTGAGNPYFVLYDIYTGTLRVFIYIGTPHFNNGQVFVLYSEIAQSQQWHTNPIPSSEATTAGLLLNSAGAYSIPMSLANTKTNGVREYVVPGLAQSRTWIVKDYNLSFDRNLSQYKSLFFNVLVESIDSTKVSLGGFFNLKENTIFKSVISNSSAGNVLSNVLNLPKDIRITMNHTGALHDGLHNLGNKLQNKGGFLHVIGKNLSAVATGIGGGPVGFGVGIAKYIASFTNLLGGATTRSAITFGTGDLTISGHFINNQEKTYISFPLPQVQYPHQPRGVRFHANIGLFSLKQVPQVTLNKELFSFKCRDGYSSPYHTYTTYGIYLQFDDQNMKDLFNVNNNSNMKLKTVRAIPIMTSRLPILAPHVFSEHYKILQKNNIYKKRFGNFWIIRSAGGYDFDFELGFSEPNNYRRFNYGYLMAGVNKNRFPSKITVNTPGERCRDVTYDDGGGFTFKSIPVKIRFYLKFKNKDNSNIKAEFMRTYKAHVTTGDLY